MSTPTLRPGDKVVLATFGTYGDIAPFVAIGAALARRGVRAVVATSDYYRGFVEQHGLEFAQASPSEAQLCGDLGMSVPAIMQASMHKFNGPRFAVRKVVTPYLREGVGQLKQACEDAQLVLSHVYSFAAPMVHELTGIPWRSVCLQPMALMSPWDPAVLSEFVPLHRLQPLLGAPAYAKVLNALKAMTRPWLSQVDAVRQEVGLPCSSQHPLFEGAYSPQGTYGLFDPLLMPQAQAPDSPGLPPHWTWAGQSFSDGSGQPLSDELQAFLDAGPAPVVVTLGTSAVQFAGDVYRVAAEAARRLGVRAVLLTGSNELGALSPGVLAVPWASHAQLFPRASAVVHQGGSGTVGQALRAQVPQLVIPYGNDQPDNAARLERLGVGRTLRSWRTSSRNLATELEALLSPANGYATRACAVQMRAEDGAELVARDLTA